MHDSPRTPEPGSSDVLDPKVIEGLRELGGDDDPGLLVELIDIFLRDAPERLKDMHEGLATGDVKRVERAAHTLKSSSANIGAPSLASLCRRIEESARGSRLDGVADLCSQSEQSLGRVSEALRLLRGGP